MKRAALSGISDLKRIILSVPFLLSAVICFFTLFVEVAPVVFDILGGKAEVFQFQDAYYFNISIHFGYYIYAVPLLCAFSSSGLFCDDYESGFYRMRLMRSGKAEYRTGLWVGTTLGGGLAIALGMLAFSAFLAAFLYPYDESLPMATVKAWESIVQSHGGGYKYMLLHTGLGFLFGMIWSGVGIALSLLTPNRYICYFAPFVICLSLTLLMPANLQPLEMLVQMRWEKFSFVNLVIYQVVLYGLVYFCFHMAFNRRISHA